MIVPPMQSISGNNDGTYMSYMLPPHGRYARFAMPAMFGASAAEVRWLLINSWDFGCIWNVTVISLAIPHLLILGFLCFTWVGTGLGQLIPTWSVCWKCREHPQLLSTTKLLREVMAKDTHIGRLLLRISPPYCIIPTVTFMMWQSKTCVLSCKFISPKCTFS